MDQLCKAFVVALILGFIIGFEVCFILKISHII